MKNILVTGACGFIGSSFIRQLLARDVELVVAFDLLTYAGLQENLAGVDGPRFVFFQGDIADRARVEIAVSRLNVDTIVHFAAESHVDRSIHDPGAFVRTNIVGTWTLLDIARQQWKGRSDVRFHHVSTDEVYGSLTLEEPAFTERTPYDPSSPYSASKAASDHLVRAYGKTYGLPVTISNCSNNYGPRQYPEKLIPLMIQNAMAGESLPVYGDGKQRRDWLYVDDHSDAILAILEKGIPGETYNVGGGAEKENLEIVKAVCALVDVRMPTASGQPRVETLIKYVSDRPGHDRRYAIDHRKITENLGWAPKHSFEQGLEKTVAWYIENPQWLKTVKDRGSLADWQKKNYQERQ
jgi:dTDP-glucose 4,6-dehydratase